MVELGEINSYQHQYTNPTTVVLRILYDINKITPCATPLPLVALFVPILLGIMPPKALAESQGVILYFSIELVGILLEKRMHNQLRIYKFYEWKQTSRTSVIFQHEFMECNFGD